MVMSCLPPTEHSALTSYGAAYAVLSPVGLPCKKTSKQELSLVVEGKKSNYPDADVHSLLSCGEK